MKALQSTKAKTHFSIKDVKAGNEVAITYGKKKQKRQLGTLEGKMSVEFANDFAMTDEELINL